MADEVEGKVMISARLDAGLVRWLKGYALQRQTSTTALIDVALVNFRDLCTGGVPDVPLEVPRIAPRRSAARQGKVRGSGGPSSPGSASPAVSRPAAGDAPASERRPLIYVAADLERERFGSSRNGVAHDLLMMKRRIKLGRVQVAGEVVRDPEAMVDPSEVSL